MFSQLGRTIWVFVLATAFVRLMTVPDLIAQEGGSPPIIHSSYVKVKPTMVQEYVDIMKNEMVPAWKKTEAPWMATWEIWPYGDGNTFLVFTSIPGFSTFDGPHPLLAILGPEKLTDMMSRLSKCVDGFSGNAFQYVAEASFMSGEPRAAVLWRADVQNGKMDEAIHFLATDVKSAMKDSGRASYIVLSTIFGEASDIHALTVIDAFSDLDKGHPIRQARKPEEARRIYSTASSLFKNDSAVTMRYRKDLSYREE